MYARSEEFKHALEVLIPKLQHVQKTCGSAYIHDANLHTGLCTSYLDRLIESKGSEILNMFNWEEPPYEQYPDRKSHPLSEKGFDNLYLRIIENAENFLVSYSRKEQ